MNAQKLEILLRNWAEFRALYEDTGLDTLVLDDGFEVNIHDILRGIRELPTRQRQAVVLTCLRNYKEKDAARVMGLKWASPVGLYKKNALRKLVNRYWLNGLEPGEETTGNAGAGSRNGSEPP